MVKNNQHIIQKVQAELTVSSKEQHREQSERLKRAVQQAVQNVEPEMNKIPRGSIYRIDSLSVELTIPSADLDRLEEHLENAVREKILEAIQPQSYMVDESFKPGIEHISSDKSYHEILSAFLKTGRLPWWVEAKDLTEVEGWLTELSAKEWIIFIKPLARSKPAVIRRIVAQFRVSVVQQLIQKTAREQFGDDKITSLKSEILQITKDLGIAESVQRQIRMDLDFGLIERMLSGVSQEQIVDELLVSAVNTMVESKDHKINRKEIAEALGECFELSERSGANLWTNRLKKILRDQDRFAETSESDRMKQKENLESPKTETEQSGEKEGLTAVHAGVVILHPFLESLFKNLGYIEGGDFLNEAARERAVCLVHYLATGREEFPEFELLFPKFLCGWPLDSPINRFLSLAESEKDECESLLLNCIQHWEALKNTSIGGLQENFLRREGILKREEFGWSLYVEQKTQDILLNKLPWNLSIVKLKWMNEMLTVHWH